MIDDYLKKVEKNLKGFTQEAKNSILIEIEEHILERVDEEKIQVDGKKQGEDTIGGGERGRGGEEMDRENEGTEVPVQKVLEEYGKPEEVARAYSPIIRLSQRGTRLFQGYSLLVSLSFLYVTLPQFLYDKDDFWGYWQLTVFGLFGAFLAYACIFFNLVYVSRSEKLIKYSRISVYSNTFLGMVFLILVLNWYLDLMGAIPIDLYRLKDVDLGQDAFYYAVLFATTGILSYHISTLGHSMMTQDTKDGIAPYQNISSRVLPILLVINVLTLLVISRQMWDTFEFISLWNSPIAYWVLGITLFITLSSASLLVLHVRNGLKMVHIEREVFAIMIVCLILTSGIAGGFYREEIDIDENWGEIDEDEPWDYEAPDDHDEQEMDPMAVAFDTFDYGGLLNNGSMYSWELIDGEGNRTFRLSRWKGDLTGIDEEFDVPINIDPAEYLRSDRSVRSSGHFIHIRIQFRKVVEENENNGNVTDENETVKREMFQFYLLMTFDGRIIGQELIPTGEHYWYAGWDLVVDDRNASIIRTQNLKNMSVADNVNWTELDYPSYPLYDAINLSFYSFSNGKLLRDDLTNVTISLAGINSWGSMGYPFGAYLPGKDSFSMGFSFRRQFRKYDENIDNPMYETKYHTKISVNGSIEIPPVMIANTSFTSSDSSENNGNAFDYWILGGYENDIILLERDLVTYPSVKRILSYRIVYDGANGDVELIRSDLKEYNGTEFTITYTRVTRDENGILFIPIFESVHEGSRRSVSMKEYQLDWSGEFSLIRSRDLQDVPAFGNLENINGGYDGLHLILIPYGYYSNGNTSYSFIEGLFSDGSDKHIHSLQFDLILIANESGLTYYQIGGDIDPMETKNVFFATIFISSILGIGVPASLWFLMKRRTAQHS